VLTQAKLGRWLGLTQGQVSRLERSAQPTNDLNKLDHWARALQIPERSLWFRLSQKPHLTYSGSRVAYGLDYGSEAGGDVQRRKLLQHIQQLLQAMVASAAIAEDLAFEWFGTPSMSSSGTRAVGTTDVQGIREMTQAFRRLDNRFGGGYARSALINYLTYEVVPLLREGRYRDEVGRDLAAAVVELSQLAGWMAYDVGDADSGCRHLRRAMRLSLDAGNDALAGEMLAGMSHHAAFLRSPALARDLARAAKDKGKHAGIPALVSESAVMEAHALALANDVRGCLAALRESERAFGTAEKRERPEWLAYFDGAYLAAKFGHCFRDLGRPVEAEQFARRSLEMIDGYDRLGSNGRSDRLLF
jgi:transcriptional regulator with XRE-family HTH domain